MEKEIKILNIISLSVTIILSTNANAALLERLGGLAYYDTEANLTWLADANYAQTSGFIGADSVGRLSWKDANNWAAGLNISGVTGWRLSEVVQPDDACSNTSPFLGDRGSNCTGSEMGNLFYNVLGGGDSSLVVSHNANYDLFSNIQSRNYWTGTENLILSDTAWSISFRSGNQGVSSKNLYNHMWAVYSGDVGNGMNVVPVPSAVWLFVSGLIGLFAVSRDKSNN